MKFFCFPHAGVFSPYYRFMKEKTYDNIERVLLFDYPRRSFSNGGSEVQFSCYILSAVEFVRQNICCGEEYILFGHSMGAFVACEAGLILQNNYSTPPTGVIASGQNPPYSEKNEKGWVCPEEPYGFVEKLGGVPEFIRNNKRLFSVMMKCIADDMKAIETYTGRRMYLTGDIDILGRDDDQIKFNGKRIELTEIESAAVRDKRISASVAIFDTEKKIICLYYTVNAPITANELEAHLERELPRYMLPSAYMELGAFPLSVTGKVDKKALPEFEMRSNDEERTQDVACPEVLAVYCDILGRDHLTLGDNFFRCGGDSLKAIRLLYELNDRTGTLLQLTDIFEFPVIYDMQNHIASVLKGV